MTVALLVLLVGGTPAAYLLGRRHGRARTVEDLDELARIRRLGDLPPPAPGRPGPRRPPVPPRGRRVS